MLKRDDFIRGGRARESERVDLPKVQLSVRALSWSLFFGATDLHRVGQKLLGSRAYRRIKRRLSAHTYAHARTNHIEISDNVLIGLECDHARSRRPNDCPLLRGDLRLFRRYAKGFSAIRCFLGVPTFKMIIL